MESLALSFSAARPSGDFTFRASSCSSSSYSGRVVGDKRVGVYGSRIVAQAGSTSSSSGSSSSSASRRGAKGRIQAQAVALPAELGSLGNKKPAIVTEDLKLEYPGYEDLPPTAPWHALDTLWEADEKVAMHNGTMPALLSPAWKVMLLSDGSVTRHLQILTDLKVDVELIDETTISTDWGAPVGTDRIQGPLLQRQVNLKRKGGETLVYAASWWSEEDMKKFMTDGDKPIWVNLQQRRAELFREVQRVYLGTNKELEEIFGCKGPFWARHYTFWTDGRPLTLIYEVFSPKLETWLGNSKPEGFDENGLTK